MSRNGLEWWSERQIGDDVWLVRTWAPRSPVWLMSCHEAGKLRLSEYELEVYGTWPGVVCLLLHGKRNPAALWISVALAATAVRTDLIRTVLSPGDRKTWFWVHFQANATGLYKLNGVFSARTIARNAALQLTKCARIVYTERYDDYPQQWRQPRLPHLKGSCDKSAS
jgi:hypothetical protein